MQDATSSRLSQCEKDIATLAQLLQQLTQRLAQLDDYYELSKQERQLLEAMMEKSIVHP